MPNDIMCVFSNTGVVSDIPPSHRDFVWAGVPPEFPSKIGDSIPGLRNYGTSRSYPRSDEQTEVARGLEVKFVVTS